MDNKINEIRRKIRFLRSEMLDLEDAIRLQINRDEDCSDTGRRLMDMRRQMVALVGQRDALGGRERDRCRGTAKGGISGLDPETDQGRSGSPWMNLDL
jgi:hypothetical protein